MKLTDYSIRHRITVFVLVLILVVFGGYSYHSLPTEAAPDITIPFIIVNTIYIGAPPQDMESLVTRQIEKELQGLENVKEIRSTSVEGGSTITVEFNPNVDLDDALQRVKDRVDRAKPELPEDAEDPIVMEVNLSNIPIMIVNLSGDFGLVRLKEIAADLADEIETIPGILEVNLTGGLEHEVQVDVDPERLAVYGLALQNVVDAVRRENVTLPGGSVEMGPYKYSVRVPGELESVDEIGDLVIRGSGGVPVYIRDVASIAYGFEERKSYARLNQQSCVSLSITKRSGENLIKIADRVKEEIERLRPTFPPGTQVTILADQSEDIRLMVRDLENNIISGLLLVVAVLFLFMGIRNAFFVGVAIPLSMLVSFIVLAIMEITLNMVVLFSLILALGMLVDNAIVVVENIYRHRQEGREPDDGARVGTSEVATPVIASTLTTLCAFAPLIFWPGVMGEFMKYLPITLIVTLSSSLFVGLVINPTFCASFMKVKGTQAETSPLLNKALERYQRVLERALDHPWITSLVSGTVLIFVVSIYSLWNHGVEFFPEVEPRKAYIDARAPSGTSLDASDRIVRRIEEILTSFVDVDIFVANVGAGAGGFASLFGGEGESHNSRISIDFVDEDEQQQSSLKTLEQFRASLRDITGAEIEITKERTGPPTGAPISVEISGEDFAVLGDLAARARRIIAGVPGAVDLKDDYDRGRPEIQVRVDRESAALVELNTSQIASTVRTAVYGTKASEYRVGEDEYDIRVRFREDRRRSLADLEQITIEKDGRLIPLSSVARIETSGGLGSIRRKDLERVVTIEGKVQGRTSDAVLKDVRKQLVDLSLPPGYRLSYTGENEEQEKASAFLGKAFVVAVFAIALVLITQFDSIMLPVAVLSSVFLSLVGVLIGLLVTGMPFGILMTGVGIISLAGVVVNNAIVLIDYTLQLFRRGLSRREAIVQAGLTRFRPVILTAVTTILGLIPLTTGISFDFYTFTWQVSGRSSQWWGPMGVAVVFGLAFATALTLIVVPVVVSLIWRPKQTA